MDPKDFPLISLKGLFSSPKSDRTVIASSKFSSIINFEGVISTLIFAFEADSNPRGESSIARQAELGNFRFSNTHSYISGEGFDNSFVIEDEKINISVDLKLEIPKTLKKLIEQNNTIVLIYPIPEQGWNVPNRYFYGKENWGEAVYYPHQVWKERVLESKLILDSIVSEKIVRIYPEDIFCDSFVRNNCVGSFENDIFYSDDDHLSLVGANLLAKNIIDNIHYLLD